MVFRSLSKLSHLPYQLANTRGLSSIVRLERTTIGHADCGPTVTYQVLNPLVTLYLQRSKDSL